MREYCGAILECANTWDFGKVPWVTRKKGEEDPKVIAAGKIVEQYAQQFTNLQNYANRLLKSVGSYFPANEYNFATN